MDEDLPILSVDAPEALEGTEEVARLTFTVTLSEPSDEPVTFTVDSVDNATLSSTGSPVIFQLRQNDPDLTLLAADGADYQGGSGAAFTLPPGQTSGVFSVELVNDSRFEADEQFGLLLSNITGARTADGDDTVFTTGTILNDDPRPANTGANALIMDIDGLGRVIMHLRPDLAPVTVERIVELTDQGFYDGLTFHRVVEGFVAQGGDPDGNGTGGSGTNIIAEFSNEPYVRGTVGMARSSDPNSADSQFFIGLESTAGLASLEGRFTVFARVEQGMEVIDALPRSPVDGVVPEDPGVISVMESRVLSTFDPVGYLQANPDVAAAGFDSVTAIDHLTATGAVENRVLFFDGASYLTANPDVAGAGFTADSAIDHYLGIGRAEGRLLDFDGDQYLRINTDVAAAGLTADEALGHFLSFGRSEGRLTEFDDIAYLIANPDVAAAGLTSFEAALGHFLGSGRAEGRGFFDGDTYLQFNGDVAAAGFLAETHFGVAGLAEGRVMPLKGTVFDDLLIGTSGDDILRGLSGDDTIDGGDGFDIAVFDDVLDAYSFDADADSDNDDSTVTVKHLRGDLDTDLLINIEMVRFVDQMVPLSDLIA